VAESTGRPKAFRTSGGRAEDFCGKADFILSLPEEELTIRYHSIHEITQT
jgi:hypothetical protein